MKHDMQKIREALEALSRPMGFYFNLSAVPERAIMDSAIDELEALRAEAAKMRAATTHENARATYAAMRKDIDHEAAERIARDLGKTYQWPGDDAVRLVFAAYLDALEKLRSAEEEPGDPKSSRFRDEDRCIIRNWTTNARCCGSVGHSGDHDWETP